MQPQLIERALRVIRELGRAVASIDEARHVLQTVPNTGAHADTV